MLQKPNTCAKCPLFTKSLGFIPDDIPANVEVLMYGEAGGKTEVATGKPFQGKAGFVLKNWGMLAVPTLRLLQERGRVGYANVLRCLPPEVAGRAFPQGAEKEAAIKCCSQYDDLGTAKTIILCGEHPQRKFLGPELEKEDLADRRLGREVKGVMGRVGRVVERNGRRFVFAPHPAFVLRQPALVGHLQEALKIAANTERTVEVDYMPWERALEEVL